MLFKSVEFSANGMRYLPLAFLFDDVCRCNMKLLTKQYKKNSFCSIGLFIKVIDPNLPQDKFKQAFTVMRDSSLLLFVHSNITLPDG
jgi:hypothetical protein